MFFFLSCFFVPVFAFSFFLHLSFCLSAFRSFCLSVHFFLLTSHFLSLAANLLFGLLWIFFGISEVRIVCHHFRFWQQRTERAPTHRAKKKNTNSENHLIPHRHTQQNRTMSLSYQKFHTHNSGPPTASRLEPSIWSPTKSLEMALANSTAARLSKPWFDSCEVVWRSKTDSCSNLGDTKFGFNLFATTESSVIF